MFDSDRLIDFLVLGGPVVWLLCSLSTMALTITLIKLAQFAYWRAERSTHLERALARWEQGEPKKALAGLNSKHPQDELVAYAMQGVLADTEEATLREELKRMATAHVTQLRRYLRPLEVIATLSPLLGLLGTVLGMIIAFQQMEAAGSQVDPSVLSGGIWQALLTTAVGICVAVPVLVTHQWMERKVERITHVFNDTVTRVFTRKAMPVSLNNRHAA
jgi:biopolymer transport protein ExbB